MGLSLLQNKVTLNCHFPVVEKSIMLTAPGYCLNIMTQCYSLMNTNGPLCESFIMDKSHSTCFRDNVRGSSVHRSKEGWAHSIHKCPWSFPLVKGPSRQFWDCRRWKSGLSIVIWDCGRWKSGPCLLGCKRNYSFFKRILWQPLIESAQFSYDVPP